MLVGIVHNRYAAADEMQGIKLAFGNAKQDEVKGS